MIDILYQKQLLMDIQWKNKKIRFFLIAVYNNQYSAEKLLVVSSFFQWHIARFQVKKYQIPLDAKLNIPRASFYELMYQKLHIIQDDQHEVLLHQDMETYLEYKIFLCLHPHESYKLIHLSIFSAISFPFLIDLFALVYP